MEYLHLKKWTMPAYYFGAQWPEYYSSGVGQSCDSSALERANFQAMLDRLGGETGENDDGVSMVTIVRENHWAVGWVEWIAIHESNTKALEIADSIQAKLESYPVIDEELWSQLEDEECEQTWSTCYDAKERLEYFRKNSWSNHNGIAPLLRAIRGGDWYEAANMLHCPSDLIS